MLDSGSLRLHQQMCKLAVLEKSNASSLPGALRQKREALSEPSRWTDAGWEPLTAGRDEGHPSPVLGAAPGPAPHSLDPELFM